MADVDVRKNYEKVKGMKLSPTSISTLFKCRRQFWYKYIEKQPDKPSIHLVKGIAVHHSLEKVFDGRITDKVDLKEQLYERAERHYIKRWNVSKLDLTEEELKMHYADGLLMIENFVKRLADNITLLINAGKVKDVYHAFNLLKPKFKEVRLKDDILKVGGSIDQVNTDFDNHTTLVDLKTSSKYKNNIPEDYERQLAIYAYLYQVNYKELPRWVCINYLRYGESFYIRVTDSFIQWAISEVERARDFLLKNNMKNQYFKKESALCPYCAYRDICLNDSKKEKKSEDFFKELKKNNENGN